MSNRVELERRADEILRKASEDKRAAKRSPWVISSDAEREHEIVNRGLLDDDLRAYARDLRTSRDPRGELAHLLAVGDEEAINKFIKAHAKQLLSGPNGRTPMRHVRLHNWRQGFLDHAGLRLDKLTDPEISSFLGCPAARFLRRLTFDFIDESDDAIQKERKGLAMLERASNRCRVAACRDALEVVHVRSLDPSGQPPRLIDAKLTASAASVKPMRRLRDFRVVFDSEEP